jgi:hypothetical protein
MKGGSVRGSRTRLRGLVLTLSIAMLSTVMGATGAIAAETHVFDPTLSLTGGCGVSTLDPVPDPAEPPCPSPEPQCPTTPVGAHPPSGCFSSPAGIATDAYGNIYVASAGPEASLGAQGRIDIFDSSGYFITEVLDDSGPGSMAVDSKGNLYVANRFSEKMENVVRYSPTGTYDPEEGEIEYGDPPTVLVPQGFSSLMGLDVDRTNDRLFVKFSSHVTEYKSAEELNAEVGEFGNGMIE